MIPLLPLLLAVQAVAYIPASPTNSSQDAIAGGLNMTDISKLRLRWYSDGNYMENVSYQLAGNGSQGVSKGILIHFSEDSVNELTPPTSAPWIAMVSCDANATNASMDVDIFTLARDKGAVSALLYSLYSFACVINPEYADPATFDQVFDIFSTQSKTSAHLIDYQFGQLTPTNTSISKYDSQRLNDTANAVNDSIEKGYATQPGFLYGVLRAYNATEDDDPVTTDGSNASTNTGHSSSGNTALAMIILYAITGCVSALFCVVIISGAIRAVRHPERYGPRARMGLNGSPQGRARGLTRAILDTFPIVKFGGTGNGEGGSGMGTSRGDSTKDAEAQELSHWEVVDQTVGKRESALLARNGEQIPLPKDAAVATSPDQGFVTFPSTSMGSGPKPSTSRIGPYPQDREGPPPPATATPPPLPQSLDPQDTLPIRADLSPEAMGRATCPICIVDFEEGDDIRVLPCEGKHRFHPQCVDQWLLELSSSCPICRQDFLALASILSHEDERESQEFDVDGLHPEYPDREHHHHQHQTLSPQRSGPMAPAHGNNNRFSKYLRFATGRRHRREQQEQEAQQQEQLNQHYGSSSSVLHPDESSATMHQERDA